MTELCGCYVKHAGGEDGVTPTITYCPMHAAVGDMLAALEAIAAWSTQADGARGVAKRALAAARSGAPRLDVLGALVTALKEASDHLDYCGYGDSWEREAAVSSGLPEKIVGALRMAAARGGEA